jgi:hypothetical protein
MCIRHRWNDSEGAKPKYTEKDLSQFYFVQQKSHMDWHGVESGRVDDLFGLLSQHLQVST